MNKIAFGLSLLAAFYSPVNSLSLNLEQINDKPTPDKQGSSGPITTSALSFHGTNEKFAWAEDSLNSFWEYPKDEDFSGSISGTKDAKDLRWITKDAEAFCANK